MLPPPLPKKELTWVTSCQGLAVYNCIQEDLSLCKTHTALHADTSHQAPPRVLL